MFQYMVEITLPRSINQDFMDKIPAQRARVTKMMRENKLLTYTLAADRSRLWATFMAGSEQEVMDLLATFPLIGYMRKVEVHALMFNEISAHTRPQFSLN